LLPTLPLAANRCGGSNVFHGVDGAFIRFPIDEPAERFPGSFQLTQCQHLKSVSKRKQGRFLKILLLKFFINC
jgi:hypothetical protein